MTECHLSVMSQQTTTATNQASVMHAVIHAWYMSGLISHSVYVAIADSGPRGPRYIGALLYFELAVGHFTHFTANTGQVGPGQLPSQFVLCVCVCMFIRFFST